MTDDELILLAKLRMELTGAVPAGWVHGLPTGYRQLLTITIDELTELRREGF